MTRSYLRLGSKLEECDKPPSKTRHKISKKEIQEYYSDEGIGAEEE